MKEHFDWEEVVAMKPQGYVEIQDPRAQIVIHGPIESISVDENDFVQIRLKWAAKMGAMGTPTFMEWVNSPENKTMSFPNLVVPFVIEDTPEKGRRVRFGFNILYIDPVEGLDPKKVEGLES